MVNYACDRCGKEFHDKYKVGKGWLPAFLLKWSFDKVFYEMKLRTLLYAFFWRVAGSVFTSFFASIVTIVMTPSQYHALLFRLPTSREKRSLKSRPTECKRCNSTITVMKSNEKQKWARKKMKYSSSIERKYQTRPLLLSPWRLGWGWAPNLTAYLS
jgi:DNA-directed RNA polymerase subunit RPC12/RpoP